MPLVAPDWSLIGQVKLETIIEFADPIVKSLKAAGVRVKFDDRINYTAGWK